MKAYTHIWLTTRLQSWADVKAIVDGRERKVGTLQGGSIGYMPVYLTRDAALKAVDGNEDLIQEFMTLQDDDDEQDESTTKDAGQKGA
jgi:hypothetical protein